MKTIELNIGDKKAIFTTKSLTMDNVEFFYSKMTNVSHDSTANIYKFTYDGEDKVLEYADKDSRILQAIFSQVMKIDDRRRFTQKIQNPLTSADEPSPKPLIVADAMKQAETEVKSEAETLGDSEAPEEAKVPADSEVLGEAESQSEEKVPEEAETQSKDEAPEETKTQEVNDEKKASRKKSFIVFGIIIAAILLASIIYFFVFGTSKTPKDTNPINTESQQYDDIEQLIDDLQ